MAKRRRAAVGQAGEVGLERADNLRPASGAAVTAAAGAARRTFFAIARVGVAEYARLIGGDDLGTIERLRKLRRGVIAPALREHGGRVLQANADSLLVIFDSLTEAVRCMVDVQRMLPVRDEGSMAGCAIRLRVGIELGDVVADGAAVHGTGVAAAVRLEQACPPGGIYVSGSVYEQVRKRVDFAFEPAGRLPVSNSPRGIEVFAVRLDAGTGATPANAGTTDADRAVWQRPVSIRGEPPRLAVLPFEQFDQDPIPKHVSDGLVADIICQLAGLRDLAVVSHGSTIGLRGSGADPTRIGRQLQADYLVRGALRRVGARARLTTELVETGGSSIVWARAIDVDDLMSFDGQDRVVGQVVNTLAPRVREIELHRIRGKRPDSLTVYEKVLLARENILMLQPDAFAQAKLLLDQATAAEPDYAEAYALAADWHGLMVGQGWSADRKADVAAVDRLAQQALLLDGDNVRALVCYGHRKSLLHRDYPAALEMFRRALDAAPSSAHAWLKSSYTFAYIGEAGEAVRRAERAVELSPRDREPHLFYSALCVAHYTAGNFDTAACWGMQTLHEPTMLRATVGWTAASLAAAGRTRQARDLAAGARGHWPHRGVSDAVARHPYQDPAWRHRYGEHLLAAGFPP
jgi:adenylate cyclase